MLITIPAGINKMNVVKFITLSLIGTTIWNLVLIYLGKMLSGSWDVLMNGLHTYSYVMYIIIIIAVISIIFTFYKKRNTENTKN